MATTSLILELNARADDAIRDVNTLRRDLDDLSDSADNTDSSMSRMSSASSVMAKGVGAVATAAAAAATAIISASSAAAAYAREIRIASDVSGVAAEQIQLMAHATATVGIGLEQLGDISKDTREKIGDFLNTGGGGFQDFVDAMKLSKKEARLLANEFKDLSGPEILQRMVIMMEDADVSAVQMSHALEGMASETTRLIPLLANGGEKMQTISDNMKSVIVPLTDEDIQVFIKMGEASDVAIASLKSLGQQVLLDLSEAFVKAADKAAHFYASLNEGTEAQKTTRLADIKDELDTIKETMANAETASGRFWNAVTFNAGQSNFLLERQNELLKERKKIQGELAESRLGIGEDGRVIADESSDTKSSKEDVVDPLINPEANDAAIQLLEDRFKTEAELLTEKFERELEIAAGHKELLLELENEYLENLFGLTEAADEKERLRKDKELKKKQKADDKLLREKKKQDKIDEKLEDKKAADDKKRMDDSLALAMLVFGDKKEISATLAFINTAEGVTKALASQDYAGAAVTALTGAAQIASILSADPKGGGNSVTAPSAPAKESRALEQEDDLSSLEFTDATSEGSNTQTITFATDTGDELLDVLANALNKKQREN